VLIFVEFVTPVLLTVVNAAVTGRFVRRDPSPIKRPNTVPAEIVEKNPKLVDITDVEILLAVKIPVLRRVVLRTGGRIDTPPLAIPVNPDPSPTKRPNTVPAEIVEKNPKLVDITDVEILLAVKIPVLRRVVLRIGGIIDTPPLAMPVNPDPSPTKRPKIVPAEIVEKNP